MPWYTRKELCDEDWKTQTARKYPNIPEGAEVQFVEDICNFYGKYSKVRYKGILYYVKPTDIYYTTEVIS